MPPGRANGLYVGAVGGAFGAFWWQVCNPSALALTEPKKAIEREHGTLGYAASPAADPHTVSLVGLWTQGFV